MSEVSMLLVDTPLVSGIKHKHHHTVANSTTITLSDILMRCEVFLKFTTYQWTLASQYTETKQDLHQYEDFSTSQHNV